MLFSSSGGALLYVTEGKTKGTVKNGQKPQPPRMKSQNTFQKTGKKFYAGFTLSDAQIHTVNLPISAGQSQSQPNTSLTASKNDTSDCPCTKWSPITTVTILTFWKLQLLNISNNLFQQISWFVIQEQIESLHQRINPRQLQINVLQQAVI